MLKDLRQGTFAQSTNWVSIPEVYLDPIALPSPPTRVGGAALGVGGTTTTHGSTQSGVSSLTTPTTAPQERIARVVNPAPDPEISGVTIRRGGGHEVSWRPTRHRPTMPARANCVWPGGLGAVVTLTAAVSSRTKPLRPPPNGLGCSLTSANTWRRPKVRTPDGEARVARKVRPGSSTLPPGRILLQ